jgi:murein DD-endopeptidase MepM/ murein hydrolase activator NlpD
LLNASVGVQRVLGRLHRPPSQPARGVVEVRQRRLAAARRLRHGLHSVAAATDLLPARPARVHHDRPVSLDRRSLLHWLGQDRAVAIAVVGILVGASVLSVTAGHAAPNTGNTSGAGTAAKIVIGGTGGTEAATDGSGPSGDGSTADSGASDGSDATGDVQFGDPNPPTAHQDQFAAIDLGAGSAAGAGDAQVDVEGPFIEDGTLVKPIAVNTVVPDGSALIRTYTVKSGDTIAAIATEFKVSTMSVIWANNLKSKTDVHKGDVLRIPPVTGLIVKIAATDTLDAIAARYDVDATDILTTNGLDDPNLVVGQVLVIPGAKGAALPVPKAPVSSSGGGGGNYRPPASYSGGKFLWPVVGGGNYISQYFHYGHYAIDIAADYGSEVRAAAAGTVTFAGWKNNGGGYQVWVAHGSGLYTTYNHMSAITVGAGQHVARGQQVGRIGMTGDATGPHCHFEVWIGPIWDGGRRVNPLAYF